MGKEFRLFVSGNNVCTQTNQELPSVGYRLKELNMKITIQGKKMCIKNNDI